MKLLDNNLYLDFSEMVECLMLGGKDQLKAEIYLSKAKSTGTKCWKFANDPSDRRRVLIGYEKLKDNYKALVNSRFGNPYEYIAKMPIKALVEKDAKAEAYFLAYRYNGSQTLPVEHVKKYGLAAAWLNMLVRFNKDKKAIKKLLNLSVDKFYEHVCNIITTDSVCLPATYIRLNNKRKEYEEKGYECLVDWRFGNKQAAKIGKTEDGYNEELAADQIALIRSVASRHNNFDACQVARAVNMVFSKNGWAEVSHGTVYNVIRANGHILTPGSRGQREYNNNIAMQVKRSRPTAPLQYFTLDGWTVELLYQEKGTYNNRLVVVVVLDAMNNYPIGYAIGDRENADLIKQANRNAILHIEEMFGKQYRPWQLQSDHYALKTLTPFYEAMGHLHTPAAVGNAKSKVVEPYFNYLNKNYCQAQYNWSGHNVTASKKNQVNAEYLDKIKTSFPVKAEVMATINTIIQRERLLKEEAYRAAFATMPDADKQLFSKEDWLMVFGTLTGHTNTITGAGLTPRLNGEVRYYDSFEPAFRNLRHLSWQVVYDKEDLSYILAVSEDNKHRFLLQEKRFLPMDVRASGAEDFAYLSQVRGFNKARREEIVNTYASDAEKTDRILSHTPLALDDFDEASIKLMFTNKGQQKEKLQDARGLKPAAKPLPEPVNDWQAAQKQYLQSKTDFNQYLD